MSVLIFADSFEGKVPKSAYEAVSYGKKIANNIGGQAIAITYGSMADDDLKVLAEYGADKILKCTAINEMQPTALASMVKAAAEQNDCKVIVFPHDYTGKSVAPMVSAIMKAGLVAGAVSLPETGNGFKVKKSVFSGKAFAFVKINTDVKVITLMPNSVGREKISGAGEITSFSAEVPAGKLRIKEFKAEGGEGVSLTEADTVVSAGRGMKGPENWGIIEELAHELGAATACSRPVADIGWRPHHEHVGQTGIAIRPNLYIAIGISGAIQHLAGVNGSKVIVVINTDPEAPFFKAADYGIVGDAFEVVPKLIEAVKRHKAEHA